MDNPFDALIFDAGDTLIYFDGKYADVYPQGDAEMLRSLQSSGFDPGGDAFLVEFRRRLRKFQEERNSEFLEYTTAYILRTLLDELGYNYISDSALRLALDARYTVTRAYWQVEPDALQTLKTLRKSGYRLGLISNAGDDADVQSLIDKAGIRPYFDVITTSAAQGIRKPNPRIFHWVLDRMGVSASRSAMIGDTLGADILGAHNANMYAIWITRRADTAANRAHRDTILPDATISTLEELPGLLRSLA